MQIAKSDFLKNRALPAAGARSLRFSASKLGKKSSKNPSKNDINLGRLLGIDFSWISVTLGIKLGGHVGQFFLIFGNIFGMKFIMIFLEAVPPKACSPEGDFGDKLAGIWRGRRRRRRARGGKEGQAPPYPDSKKQVICNLTRHGSRLKAWGGGLKGASGGHRRPRG